MACKGSIALPGKKSIPNQFLKNVGCKVESFHRGKITDAISKILKRKYSVRRENVQREKKEYTERVSKFGIRLL
jgi:hypothetical protein